MIDLVASTSMFASKAGGMLWLGSESPARAACHSHSIVPGGLPITADNVLTYPELLPLTPTRLF